MLHVSGNGAYDLRYWQPHRFQRRFGSLGHASPAAWLGLPSRPLGTNIFSFRSLRLPTVSSPTDLISLNPAVSQSSTPSPGEPSSSFSDQPAMSNERKQFPEHFTFSQRYGYEPLPESMRFGHLSNDLRRELCNAVDIFSKIFHSEILLGLSTRKGRHFSLVRPIVSAHAASVQKSCVENVIDFSGERLSATEFPL